MPKNPTSAPKINREAAPGPTGEHDNSFLNSYGVVWVNEIAGSEFKKQNPNFPVGSMIVREKYRTAELGTPEVVIAMVKREIGFSSETGDWEYFVFKGNDMSLTSRETKSSCSECHSGAKETDWVFRTYVKN